MALCSFNDPHGTSDKARQFLLDRACERKHPKRHRTQKRSKALSAKKKRALKMQNALRDAARHKHHAAVKAYWRGDTDVHP